MNNNTPKLKGPFLPIDPRWWPAIIETFEGSWSRECAAIDLRFYEMQVQIGRRASMPSKRFFMRRWSWTDYKTRQLMRDEEYWSSWEVTQKPPKNRPETAQKPAPIVSDEGNPTQETPRNRPEITRGAAHRSIEVKSLRVKQQPKEKDTYRDRYEAQRIEDMKQVISQGLSADDTASLIKSLYETVAPSRHWRPVANPEWHKIHRDTERQFAYLWHQMRTSEPSEPAPPPPPPQAEPPPPQAEPPPTQPAPPQAVKILSQLLAEVTQPSEPSEPSQPIYHYEYEAH